jgi:hypothetical protein
VSVAWLLGQKRSASPVTADGEPYTRGTFNAWEAERDKDTKAQSSPAVLSFRRYEALKLFRLLAIKVAGLLLNAHGSRNVGFVFWRLDREMKRLAEVCRPKIGRDKGHDKATALEYQLRKHVGGMNATKPDGLVAVFERFATELAKGKGGRL